MSQLLTDPITGDLKITNNNFSIVTDEQVVVGQRLFQNLRTFLGEWFLDNRIGVPYYEIVFEKGVSPDLVNDVFKDAIIKTEGVVELKTFNPLDLDPSRALQVTFNARTLEGDVEVNELEVP